MNMFFDDTTDYDHNQLVYRIQIPCVYEIKKKDTAPCPCGFTREIYTNFLHDHFGQCIFFYA